MVLCFGLYIYLLLILKILPKYELWGFGQYEKLWASRKWLISVDNLLVFTALFLIFLYCHWDNFSNLFRSKNKSGRGFKNNLPIPNGLSLCNRYRLEMDFKPNSWNSKMFIDWGFENFTFDWLVNREMAIYTIVIAGVWQSAGFVMALFLAGLRSVEDEIIKAAKIDGAGLFTVYWRILLPMMRPVFFTSFVILVHISIKSYDLIVALTQGGPGISTTMPALFMTQAAFHKSQVGLSAASAMMMFMAVAAVIIPYLYSELRRENAR